MVLLHADAKAHPQHALLARGKCGEHPRRSLTQVRLDGGVDWLDRLLILDEVAEACILFVTDRRLEGDRLLGNLEYLPNLLQWHAKLFGKLLRGRFAADLVEHFPRHSNDLVGHLDHVHWNANSPSLITDRAGDCLADPPGRVSGELVAAAVIKLVDRPHQPDIPFLYEVKKLQPTIGVFLGDR